MPTPAEILQTLAAISNEQKVLAIIWHVLPAAIVLGTLFGCQPTRKQGSMALAFPLLSVSVLAWLYKNPFNGIVFLLAAAGLAFLGSRQPATAVEKPPA
jgi:hypothetical protein